MEDFFVAIIYLLSITAQISIITLVVMVIRAIYWITKAAQKEANERKSL